MKKLFASLSLGMSIMAIAIPLTLAQQNTPLTSEPLKINVLSNTMPSNDTGGVFSGSISSSGTGLTSNTATVPGSTTSTSNTPSRPGSTVQSTNPNPVEVKTVNVNTNPDQSDVPFVPTLSANEKSRPDRPCTNVDIIKSSSGKNQIIYATIFFCGSGIGGILWLLQMLLNKKSALNRTAANWKRKNLAQARQMLTAKKQGIYNNYIDHIVDLMHKMMDSPRLSTAEMGSYHQISADINLFGSNEMRNLNAKIGAIMNSTKKFTAKDFASVTRDLSQKIHQDLLGNG